MHFGPYEVVDELARGGMGAVYSVVHVETRAPYALKTLLPEALGDEEERVRFIREARALAELQHPNLVRVFSAESEGPRPYLVQELVSGGSLQDRLLREGPLPTVEAIELVLQIADALALAHTHGILHRDLKPANVLVAEDGSTRLADFGLAKRLHGESIRLTKTGQLLGTPAYMAPEQANGSATDERTDVYGLGAVLHALLSGGPPFKAKSLIGVLAKVMDEAPEPLSDQPRAIQAVLKRAMAKNRGERQATMAIFAEELAEALSARDQSRLPLYLSLAGVLLLGLGALGYALSRPASPAPLASPLSSPSPSPTASVRPERPTTPVEAAPTELRLKTRHPIELPPGFKPNQIAYSPDASQLLVTCLPKGDTVVVLYDAQTLELLQRSQGSSGVQQAKALGRGRFLLGTKKLGLQLYGGATVSGVPYQAGTLEDLCVSPTQGLALASLENPERLQLFRIGPQPTALGSLRIEEGSYRTLLWHSPWQVLGIRNEYAQAFQIKGAKITRQGPPLELKGFIEPTTARWIRGRVMVGNNYGKALSLTLDVQGVPTEFVAMRILNAQNVATGGYQAHTKRVHTFLEAPNPPHWVSVARMQGDFDFKGSIARWEAIGGQWFHMSDLKAPAKQLCVTQSRQGRWIAAGTQGKGGKHYVVQTPGRRYFRR